MGTSESTLLWGARAIGAAIGQTERAAFHMLEAGRLPARQVGRRWVADRDNLLSFLRGDAAKEASE